VVVLATVVLGAAALYAARPVLTPLALSILLAFLLSPVAGVLERRGLGRVPSVLVVAALAFSVLGGVAWAIGTQVTSLANELPQYRHNIRQKIADLRGAGQDSALGKVKETVEDVVGELQRPEGQGKDRRLVELPAAIAPFVEGLAAAALVVVLVMFMLIRREELRDRVVRVIGYGRLTVTTKALDEAAQKISRYLLSYSVVNTVFGAALAGGLALLGLPYAILWGFLTAVLRFIPYVGAWIAALLPTALALAVFPGWVKPLLVVALFAVIEVLV